MTPAGSPDPCDAYLTRRSIDFRPGAPRFSADCGGPARRPYKRRADHPQPPRKLPRKEWGAWKREWREGLNDRVGAGAKRLDESALPRGKAACLSRRHWSEHHRRVAVFGGYYLSRPTTEVLYSGLAREDVAGIGSALREVGIPFDVSSDGTSVLVPVGQTALARMTLAEKGLPHSGSVGNELYDKLGSLGLTSFMQEVTRVRAMEGELARTIQMMRGVKAARVHIVMGDEGSFRRARQLPSASVVIRTESSDDRSHRPGHPPPRRLRPARHDGRGSHRPQRRRHAPGVGVGFGRRRAEQHARPRAERRAGHPGFRAQDACALPQPAQFPDQRRRQAEYR